MEWTKTSDKLPEAGKAVCIVINSQKFGISYDVAALFKTYDGQLVFEGDFGQQYKLTEVVAWMPFPKYHD